MKILFIQQDVFENYGIMLLSAMLKKNGHQTDILVDFLEKDIFRSIEKIAPDLIGFSITSARYAWMKGLARDIKSRFTQPIMVGGPHPTFFPDLIKDDYVDIMCVGEGEDAITELANKLEKGEDITGINNLCVKRNGEIFRNPVRDLIADLDSLPYADYDIYRRYDLIYNNNMAVFMVGRGCPFSCTFCFNKKYRELYKGKGRAYRKRSVDNVIGEIKKRIINNRKIDFVRFYDDTFTIGRQEWFRDFFRKYEAEIGLPYGILARADLLSEEIVRGLKSSGCTAVKIGLESANQYLRNKIIKKKISDEQILAAIRLMKHYKVKFQIFNMLGVPDETLETAFQTYEFNYKHRPDHAWCSLMQPYPQTEVVEIAKSKNLLGEDYNYEYCDHSFFDLMPLNLPDRDRLLNLQRLFQFGVMFRIPKKVMQVLIKVPPNPVYDMIFKAFYALGIRKLDNISWMNLLNVALHSKNYMRGSKKN